ncbi:Protein MNN4 [Cyberlindnera fabianii]|uniref:Protein MNN4 n=1 Tax=Cyberlindnera fabianii TaxID=36022 RepID=A0A1V2L6V1_CYBFA|nr:Protein MNN4 [Cyberlindnera fabianii]
MLVQVKRAITAVVAKPIVLLNSFLRSSPTQVNDSFNYRKRQNYYFKSKFLVLIALIVFASNLLLSSLIFNVSNYSSFVEATKNLDYWLRLHRSFFQSKRFLNQFKLGSTPAVFVNENRVANDFHANYSSTAFLQRLNNVYKTQSNPGAYLQSHPIDFHWADWSDTQPANAFIHAYDSLLEEYDGDEDRLYGFIHKVCYAKLFDEQDPWLDDATYNQKLQVFEHLQMIGMCSAIFKHYYWTIPERVTFETDVKYFDWPVKEKRRASPYGREGLAAIYHDKDSVSPAEVAEFEAAALNREQIAHELTHTYEEKGYPNEDLQLKSHLSQDASDFKQQDFKELLKKYENIEKPTRAERKYLDFLRYSRDNVDKANKFYFTFPNIPIDRKAELHHYNFPWIKQIISHEERIRVIHHLIRSWFKFCEHANVISWFNYGNLIGWYFNAQNLPWDNDVDVQVSINDCDKIGRYWNNTLVVENPTKGDAMYWLQTNPFYLQQNDHQVIDARYIDVKVGIYIDISALWITDREKPSYIHPKEGEASFHCKHYQWFTYDDIFPLRRTLYEGGQAYMPNAIDEILKRWYGSKAMDDWNIFDHNWQPDIGLWVPNQICEGNKVPKKEDRFDEDGQLTLYGACNNVELLNEWRHARKAYETHKKEFDLIKAGEDSTHLSEEELPVFRYFNFEDYQ